MKDGERLTGCGKIYTLFNLLLLVFVGFKSFGQEKFSDYQNSYPKETYNIRIDSKDKERFSLFIDVFSLDRVHEVGGFLINQKNYPAFIKAINDAKAKYEEWVNTAKINKVDELIKSMSFNSEAKAYFLFGDKWQFQDYVNLKFDFRIIEEDGEINYYLMILSGELTSSSNQFMKINGLALVFSSTKEIEDFLSKISKEKIDVFLNKPKKEALFND